MIPILYDKTGKIKLGELADIIDSGYVEEERNGIFEFTIDYPVGYPLSDLIVEENMIEAKANEEQDLQKFRIYDTKRLMKNIISVFARHESFDLGNDHVENVNLENASCEYALNTLFRNSHFSTHYRGYSDIINAQNYSIDNVNILNAIAGKEESIIDTYGTGAEILRDGTNIHVLNKRGHDNEVTIEFGKNLTDFVLERDLTDLETRVGGFAKYTPEGGKETIVKSNWIDSPYIENFAHPYINIEGRRDYSDKFKDGEIPTVEKIDKLCDDEFKINKRDIPKSNYTIKFMPLSKCVGYEGIQDKISLCDTVRIIDKRFNVDTKAKVIKYKYDFVKERYESMELGEPRTTLGDIIGGSSGEQGPPGKDGQDGVQGPSGEDGKVENMPDTLPSVPVLTSKVYGMGSVELSWTFENKLYYTYELYASRTKDFTPNVFDLIHAGQSSSFSFDANPGETWYFKVCAMNSHNKRTPFGNQVEVVLTKVEDMNNYFSEMAIGKAVVQSLSIDYMEAGIIKGNWIDMRHLTLTDGNGKRVIDIDSFGNARLDVTELKINSSGVSTLQNVSDKMTDAINVSTSYTNAQIQQVNNEISTKVSKDIYNENNERINGEFTEIKSTSDKISQTVERINDDYVGSTKFEQTVDDFQFKVDNSGHNNLFENPWFLAGVKKWKYALYDKGDTSKPMSGSRAIRTAKEWNIEGVEVMEILNHNGPNRHIHGIMQEVEVEASQAYTVSMYLACHRARGVLFEFKAVMENGSINHFDGQTFEVPSESKEYGATFDDFTFVKRTFRIPNGAKKLQLFIWSDENTSSGTSHMWVAKPQLEKGFLATVRQQNPNEVLSNTVVVNGDGIEIEHDSGSKSKFNHEAVEFLNNQGRTTLRVKDGGLNFHTWTNPELVGFVKSSVIPEFNNYNGVTLSTYALGDFISIGTSDSTDENSWKSYTNIMIAPHGGLGTVTQAGTWFLKDNVFLQTRTQLRNILDVDPVGHISFYDGTNTPHQIYHANNGIFILSGNNKIGLGIRHGEQSYSGIYITEDSGAVNKCALDSYGNWNFHNYTMYNMKMANTLQAQSFALKSRTKDINDTYSTMSMTDGEIRYTNREVHHIADKTLVVELPQIFAENIELDYHVNISKLSWGDYRIIDRNPYYFEIETNVEDFSFTFEVVGKLIEKPQAFTSVAKAQYMQVEASEPPKNEDSIIEVECKQRAEEEINV